MNKTSALLILVFLFNLQAYSQKAPIKFGDVSIDELRMTSYPGDTSASAVILCDYGHFNSIRVQFTRILRIKILKKEGTAWANHSYPVTTNSTIRGITFNLEDGRIVQSKLQNESIFMERVTEDYYRTRLAMPNVKAGSVIDIMFTSPGIPKIWKFQETIPEMYNELYIEPSTKFSFTRNLFGMEPLFLATPDRWIAKDMPSFKDEPYMNSSENYITKLELDIRHVGYFSFTDSWDDVARHLMKADDFGLAYEKSAYLNELSERIAESGKPDIEKMRMAYDSVKNTVRWDGHEALLTSSPSLNYIYRMKVGNSADINIMLAQLLNKLGINVSLVAMSTRENGIISPLRPTINKLNYVITSATVGDKTWLLDATEPYMPYYLLPVRCLNYQGRYMTRKDPVVENDWMELKTERKERNTVIYDLEMKDDQLNGKLTITSTDYAAYNVRKEYHKFNSRPEFIDNLIKSRSGLLIREAKLENLDSVYLPLKENYSITINNKLYAIGNEVHLLPMLLDQIPENPFKKVERKYPVDFAYTSDKSVISIIKIPENYSVSSVPSAVNMVLPGNAALYMFEVVNLGSIIKMTSRLLINKSLFLQNEYPDLREFYNQMIKKQSEPVILKKI